MISKYLKINIPYLIFIDAIFWYCTGCCDGTFQSSVQQRTQGKQLQAVERTHCHMYLDSTDIVFVWLRWQPTGLLMYLDSTDEVPDDDIDRINVRDNLKLAQVTLLV